MSKGKSHFQMYLDKIRGFPRLKRDEEVVLAMILEEAKAEMEKYEVQCIFAVGDNLEACLTKRKQSEQRYYQARKKLIEANLMDVAFIAKKSSERFPKNMLPDLIQAGNLGLIHAISKFDWRKGFRLRTYAKFWIIQRIGIVAMHYMKTTGVKSLDAATSEKGLDLYAIVTDEKAELPTATVENKTFKEILRKEVESLKSKQRTIIELRYGLSDGVEWSLREISEKLGISKERVRQLQERALRILKKSERLRDWE